LKHGYSWVFAKINHTLGEKPNKEKNIPKEELGKNAIENKQIKKE